MKYMIRAKIEVDGMVEKSDIIGAIFGQTEGLFGPDFDLRELQDKGRIGRISVDIKHQGGKTFGEILIPSNLDKAETALVAAMLEMVDKVGPFNARIRVVDIVDLRYEKIRKITERAKEILEKWFREKTVDVREVLNEIESSVKAGGIVKYGPEGLVAGPEVDRSDTLIIVEGRADVINLLKYGYKNAIAIEGAKGKIPDTVIKLSRKKRTIAFLDGDHAGDLILKELLRVAKVDYIARAPPGREVEDLTGKEIAKALKNAVPVQTYLQQMQAAKKAQEVSKAVTLPEAAITPKPEVMETFRIPAQVLKDIESLRGTLEAIVYNDKWEPLERIPVKDIVDYLVTTDKKVHAVVMDGIVTQRVADACSVKGVKVIIGARVATITKKPADTVILTFDDLTK